MTDNGLAALAAALLSFDWADVTRTNEVTTEADRPNRVFISEVDTDAFAAAILDALPPDWCGHGTEMERWAAAYNRAVEEEIATLRAELDGLVEIVSVIGGPLDVCVMEVDAGGPVCRTHYSQPVDEACYFVHQARAALAAAKETP
jgi:hypothetical protein